MGRLFDPPFVVAVSGQEAFDEVSFKDVGLSIAPQERMWAYELLAESLAAELAASDSALKSQVHYSQAITLPTAHLACGSGHIYADVWRSGERWGYSLWSGCGETDRFAWSELPREGEPVDDIPRLASAMAQDLRRALHTGCFQRHC